MMINRRDIKVIRHFNDPNVVFGSGIYIAGGVSYFLIDKEYNGDLDINGSFIDARKYEGCEILSID